MKFTLITLPSIAIWFFIAKFLNYSFLGFLIGLIGSYVYYEFVGPFILIMIGAKAYVERDNSKTYSNSKSDYRFYFQKGNEFLQQNDYSNAILNYNLAINLNPNHASIYNYRGVAYDFQNNYSNALQDYKKAILLNPNDSGAYSNCGYIYCTLGKYSDAITYFRKASSLNSNSTDSVLGIAITNYLSNNFKEASNWLWIAKRMEPLLNEGMAGIKELEKKGQLYPERIKVILEKMFNTF